MVIYFYFNDLFWLISISIYIYIYICFLNQPTECINPWYVFKPCRQNIMTNFWLFENKHFSFFLFLFSFIIYFNLYWRYASLMAINKYESGDFKGQICIAWCILEIKIILNNYKTCYGYEKKRVINWSLLHQKFLHPKLTNRKLKDRTKLWFSRDKILIYFVQCKIIFCIFWHSSYSKIL